jgi:hypothetical protein
VCERGDRTTGRIQPHLVAAFRAEMDRHKAELDRHEQQQTTVAAGN